MYASRIVSIDWLSILNQSIWQSVWVWTLRIYLNHKCDVGIYLVFYSSFSLYLSMILQIRTNERKLLRDKLKILMRREKKFHYYTPTLAFFTWYNSSIDLLMGCRHLWFLVDLTFVAVADAVHDWRLLTRCWHFRWWF